MPTAPSQSGRWTPALAHPYITPLPAAPVLKAIPPDLVAILCCVAVFCLPDQSGLLCLGVAPPQLSDSVSRNQP